MEASVENLPKSYRWLLDPALPIRCFVGVAGVWLSYRQRQRSCRVGVVAMLVTSCLPPSPSVCRFWFVVATLLLSSETMASSVAQTISVAVLMRPRHVVPQSSLETPLF